MKLSTAKYCSALSKNVSVKVKETRENYKKQIANWGTWGAGALVSSIAIVMNKEMAVMIKILKGVGVLISGASKISQQVTLCKSAKYDYYGGRFGYAYDSTAYNKDVLVAQYYSKGEFTGGFNSSDQFTWVRSSEPTAFTHAYDSIASKTISLYNSDVLANHRCTLYSPG